VTIDHGFAPDQLVAVDLDLPRAFTGDVRQLFHDLVAASETVPGVQSATVAMRLPTQVAGLRTRVRLSGARELASPATLRPVSPTFFDTVGMRVTTGRGFADSDSQRAPRVAIVNAAFVRELLAGSPALDVRVTAALLGGDPVRIVGVVGDITPAGEPDRPALYVPIDQIAIGSGYAIVRAQNDPRAILPALTARLRAAAPSLAMDRVHRVADALENSRATTRFSAQVAATFSGLALLLSMMGVYGLTASDVSARWRVVVRIAPGASRQDAVDRRVPALIRGSARRSVSLARSASGPRWRPCRGVGRAIADAGRADSAGYPWSDGITLAATGALGRLLLTPARNSTLLLILCAETEHNRVSCPDFGL
jgi:hypothetical protein